MNFKPLFAFFEDLFFPPVCFLCTNKRIQGGRLCEECTSQLKVFKQVQSFETHKKTYPCSFIFEFNSNTRPLIHALKYHNQSFWPKQIFKIPHILDHLQTLPLDWKNLTLVPVPLHPLRKRERGYNQAAVIAQALSQITKAPVQENWISRTRNNKSQTKLSKIRRNKSSQALFEINVKEFQKHMSTHPTQILLIDDVLTTGATLSQIAPLFEVHNIPVFGGLCLAYVPLEQKKSDYELELEALKEGWSQRL